MTWVKLPDELPEDPRWETAGTDAFALHIAAMAFCMRQLTDGVIPVARARRLWNLDDPSTTIAVLVDHGFWKSTEAGYEIVDFLKTQRSAEDIRAERVKAAERQRRWYEKTRESKKEPNGVSNPSSNGSTDGPPAQPSPARNKVEGGVGFEGSAGATPSRPPGVATTPVTFSFEAGAA